MLRTRASVAEMVGRYADAKRVRGALDFGDLVALAARVANEIPLAAEVERQRFKVVLLDEFQDTSHAQLVLFSRLFGGGHAVTAVGDPNQSIYGFRGASAGQLFHFVREFPVRVGDSFAVAPTSYLTTAWRNGRNILSAANVISAPLSAAALQAGPAGERQSADSVEVPPLQPSPAAAEGKVVIGRFATDEDEARAIAADVLRYRVTDFEEPVGADRVPPAMAVLCRRRAQMECIRREFELRGIPYEIVGLGGLLDTPEIVDLVATLRVLADPGRSDSLMRLLAGARWRIGPADLMAFRDWSSFLARRRGHPRSDADEADDPDAAVIESDITDSPSLVEALDWLPREGWTSAHGRTLSPAALDRLHALSAELRQLRGFMGDDLTTLLGEVERAMLLDIEVAARPGVSIHQARRNLDAFHDAAAGFLHTSHRVDVLAFLAWLEAAATEEGGLDVAAPEVNHEAVQLLTVHASKGLEWDVVFVPGLNAGAFQAAGIRAGAAEVLPCPGRCGETVPTCPSGTQTSRTKRAGWTPKRTSKPTSRRTEKPRNAGWPTWPTPGPNSCCGFRVRPGSVPGPEWRKCRRSSRSWRPSLGSGQATPKPWQRRAAPTGGQKRRPGPPPSCIPHRWRNHRCLPKVR